MTTTTDAPVPIGGTRHVAGAADHRGSWIPAGSMMTAKFKDLRRRRGLMITLAVVTVGIPALYFAIRLILHAVAPDTYGPAGGSDQYDGVVVGILYVFGFIVAATLGATAGSADLTEGMFRHHVITGRSRIALYLARIPAGLAIIVPLVAAGFTIVCLVCVFAAPTSLRYDGVRVPAGLSETAFEQWPVAHGEQVVINLPVDIGPGAGIANSPCLPNGPPPGPGAVVKQAVGPTASACTPADLRAAARFIAREDYSDYSQFFLSPSTSLMVKTGLWIELEAVIGFLVALGLSSLLGQRTVAVILMIILEIIVTPIAGRARLPHMTNLLRSVVGIATIHLEPGALPKPFGGGGPSDQAMFLHESTTVAVGVILAWIVGWTALGAWRMAKRDA
jgi:hypothetical protein